MFSVFENLQLQGGGLVPYHSKTHYFIQKEKENKKT